MENIIFNSYITTFENSTQLHNYLNYLFRVDYEQKWTNEKTQKNMVFMFNNKEIKLYPFSAKRYCEAHDFSVIEELAYRRKLVTETKEILENHNIPIQQEMMSNLRKVQISFADEPISFKKKHMLILAEAADIFNESEDVEPVIMITQEDEDNVGHVQMLYISFSDNDLAEIYNNSLKKRVRN